MIIKGSEIESVCPSSEITIQVDPELIADLKKIRNDMIEYRAKHPEWADHFIPRLSRVVERLDNEI